MKKWIFLGLAMVTILPVFSWQEFHSLVGKCKISFPNAPHHSKQSLSLSEDVTYYSYISAENNQRLFMMMIAVFPKEVHEDEVVPSLEGFLNGMLGNTHSTELKFVDLVEEKFGKAMEFLIQSDQTSFRGRVFITKDKLYLLAFESNEVPFQEDNYAKFISSFSFIEE